MTSQAEARSAWLSFRAEREARRRGIAIFLAEGPPGRDESDSSPSLGMTTLQDECDSSPSLGMTACACAARGLRSE